MGRWARIRHGRKPAAPPPKAMSSPAPSELERLLRGVEIPSCPAILTRLQKEIASPNASLSTVGTLISSDVALAGSVLKVANSAAFGLSRKVTTIQQALPVLGMRTSEAAKTLKETVVELKRPIYSIGMVLAFAFVANYSGLSATLALLLAGTGALFPFFSPFLGWLGVFLTGSDTSSNALFCSLQATTAHQVGVSDTLLVAANTTGGVTGKMISPQSIAVACAAVGLVGKESDLFRFTVKHSLLFATMVGIITTLQAYVFTWMIP